MSTKKFYLYVAAIVLLALFVREWFVIAAAYPNPTQGDVASYFRYALHLIRDGTFSNAANGEPVVPDAFRGPGYPLLLAGLVQISGGQLWLDAIQQSQVLFGTATVCATMAIARAWLGRGTALLVGILMALEPHNIAATGAAMTEVVFGFFISIALLGTVYALQRRSTILAILSGASFACGYLVNPVVALFPPLLLPLFWRKGMTRQGLGLLAVSLIAVAGWNLRNQAQNVSGFDRAAGTFVVGSRPDYYNAWKYHLIDPNAQEVMDEAEAEAHALVVDPKSGLAAIFGRMAAKPWRYVAWYALEKPFLLWDWDIRLGAGGVNYLDTVNSPLDTSAIFRTSSLGLQLLNPLVFWLAVIGVILGLRDEDGFPIAMFFLYVTAVHVVLQAEPRYSIPFKSVEILLVAKTVAHVWRLRGARNMKEVLNRLRAPAAGSPPRPNF